MQDSVDILPILDDNYVFIIRNQKDSNLIIVDPGAADPCTDYIQLHQSQLTGHLTSLITHHHPDHIDGIADLQKKYFDLKVFAPEKNREQIPWGTRYVKNDDQINTGSFNFEVMELPGHTLGICGYFEPERQWLFSGDVLFGLGCGRLFEGTPEMLFNSLKKIKELPALTKIFCTHEYTTTNMKFVEKLIAENKIPNGFDFQCFDSYKAKIKQLRFEKKPTVPLILETELACNPFLLAKTVQELGDLRQMRNQFR